MNHFKTIWFHVRFQNRLTFIGENSFCVLDWPRISPKFNQIEHLWNTVKNR